jgi:hypothetical protein
LHGGRGVVRGGDGDGWDEGKKDEEGAHVGRTWGRGLMLLEEIRRRYHSLGLYPPTRTSARLKGCLTLEVDCQKPMGIRCRVAC